MVDFYLISVINSSIVLVFYNWYYSFSPHEKASIQQALFQCLKDHHCPEVISMTEKSYLHCVRRVALKKGILIPEISVEATISLFKESVTNLIILQNCPQEIKRLLQKTIEDIKFTKIDINIKGVLE